MALESGDDGDMITMRPGMQKGATIAFHAIPRGPELTKPLFSVVVSLWLCCRISFSLPNIPLVPPLRVVGLLVRPSFSRIWKNFHGETKSKKD